MTFQRTTEYDTDDHTLTLRDVRYGELLVGYTARADNPTAQMLRSVDARLPFECATVFGEQGHVDPDALSEEERAWIAAESGIDFEGVRVA